MTYARCCSLGTGEAKQHWHKGVERHWTDGCLDVEQPAVKGKVLAERTQRLDARRNVAEQRRNLAGGTRALPSRAGRWSGVLRGAVDKPPGVEDGAEHIPCF